MADGTHFGTASAEYERGRPSYPADAVAWLLHGVDGVVLDLGAGTGKLTRSIVAAGHEVMAVDPDPAMLEELRSGVPGVPTRVGSAEEIPVDGGIVSAVLVGQAWHWFDTAAASREIARVLEPGGCLGLIWNIRDEREPWVRSMTEILHGSNAEALISAGGPMVTSPLGALEHRRYEWSREATRAEVMSMAASRSYWIAASDSERSHMRERLEDLMDSVLGSKATATFPYVTHAYRSMIP